MKSSLLDSWLHCSPLFHSDQLQNSCVARVEPALEPVVGCAFGVGRVGAGKKLGVGLRFRMNRLFSDLGGTHLSPSLRVFRALSYPKEHQEHPRMPSNGQVRQQTHAGSKAGSTLATQEDVANSCLVL